MLDLEAIKARCDAVDKAQSDLDGFYEGTQNRGMDYVDKAYEEKYTEASDAAYSALIDEAPTDIPALVTEVERLQSENARLREWILVANTQRERGATGEALASIELYAQWIIKKKEQSDV